jgi:diguanylate cyclase (GGDEF)-like protein
MRVGPVRESSTARLFAVYAVVSLVLVVLLGAFLARSYRAEAERRGIDAGTAEALLVERTAIEAHLAGDPLTRYLNPSESANLAVLTQRALAAHDILRLRLRDLDGYVVYSADGSGIHASPDDEVLDAVAGNVVSRLTKVNSDGVDTGEVGEDSIEVYAPVRAGNPSRQVGVLEMYLPYGPIDADVSAGMHTLYVNLGIGLAVLYVGLFLISMSVSRGLRRQVKANRYLAEHDPLTDLPNRASFLRLVEAAVRAPGVQPAVVAIVDLDRFKEVNDTLGHQYGDHLLTELARRLSAHLRGRDRVARLGGDEFGIVLRDSTDPETALRRIRDVIESEVHVDGLPLTLNSSIGYVLAPEDGVDPDLLLQRADVAMYLAKSGHTGVVRYDPALDHYDTANLSLLGEMRRAMRENELRLHYQPKVRLADGCVDAVEALVRWQHPTLGLLPPDRFVPLVEQTDLIDDLTEWVLGRALQDLRLVRDRFGDLTMSINVSARNLARVDFADRVAAALRAHGVPAEKLVVEITETALLADPDRAALVLLELRRLGVRVSLDDFGVGQTSLAHLATLPVDELKIDRGFVLDMTDDATHAAIVRSIVHLAHSLSLTVVAEGVETTAAATALADLGCDLAQGYLFSRPVTLEVLSQQLYDDRLVVPVA